MFRAPAMLLPHESTVAHEQRFILEQPLPSKYLDDTSSSIDEKSSLKVIKRKKKKKPTID